MIIQAPASSFLISFPNKENHLLLLLLLLFLEVDDSRATAGALCISLEHCLGWKTSVQSSGVCVTFCDPMDCSMLGFPAHHQLPELAQSHVCQVGDAIQPSHPLSFPSPPSFNLSQH